MATPRVTLPTTAAPAIGRSLKDFPEYQAELAKLVKFESDFGELQRQIRDTEEQLAQVARKGLDPKLEQQARQLVAGETPVDDVPDLRKMNQELTVLGMAINLQRDKTEEARKAAARQIAEDYLAADRQAVFNLGDAGEKFLAAFESMQSLRRAFAVASGNGDFVPEPMVHVGLNPRSFHALKNDLPIFTGASAAYTKGLK